MAANNPGGLDRDFLLDTTRGRLSRGFAHGVALVTPGNATHRTAAEDADDDGIPDSLPNTETPLPAAGLRPDTWLTASLDLDDGDDVIVIQVATIPGVGLLPLGFSTPEAASAGTNANRFLNFAPPHDGLEDFEVLTVRLTATERPWEANTPLILSTSAVPAAPAAGAVDDTTVAISALGDCQLVQARIAGADGVWNVWSRAVGDVSVADVFAEGLPFVPLQASLNAYVLDDDAGAALQTDGEVHGLTTMHRLVCDLAGDGTCAP